MKTIISLFFIILTLPTSVKASFEIDNLYLYLPDCEMKSRIASQEKFLEYAKTISDNLNTIINEEAPNKTVSMGLIVSIRPKNLSKTWFQLISGTLTVAEKHNIASRLEAIPAPDVNHGVVPFAFAIRTGGAKEKLTELPIAKEWLPFASESLEVSKVIEKAWDTHILNNSK